MDKNQELLIDKPVTDISVDDLREKVECFEEDMTCEKKNIPYKTLATIGVLGIGALAVTKALTSKKKEEIDVPEEWQEIASRMDNVLRNTKLTYDELMAHLTATYSQDVTDYVLEVLNDVITEVATESVEQFDNVEGMITPYEAVAFLVERGYPKEMIRKALMYLDIDWHEYAIYFAGLLLEEEPDMNKNILYFKLRRKPYGFTHSETQTALNQLYN